MFGNELSEAPPALTAGAEQDRLCIEHIWPWKRSLFLSCKACCTLHWVISVDLGQFSLLSREAEDKRYSQQYHMPAA